MGYGLPAAIGAALANPDKHVLCVTGDGSIMMNIQELATIKRYGLPHQDPAAWTTPAWEWSVSGKSSSSRSATRRSTCRTTPTSSSSRRLWAFPAFRLERKDDEDAAVRRLLEAEGPMLCHCLIDPKENVWPLVPPGNSIESQMHRPQN